MTTAIKATVRLLILASLLLTGCHNELKHVEDETPAQKRVVELTKQDKLQKLLSSKDIRYQTSAYSKEREEIVALGIKDTAYSFYRFDATTLVLLDQHAVKIDGVLGFKEAHDDGKFTIVRSEGSSASDYLYDSANGDTNKNTFFINHVFH